MKSDLGRDKNRGCNNGRIFLSTAEPLEKINKDMWINPNALNTLYVAKSSSTSRSSTTTLADDPHLTIALPKGGIFQIQLFLQVLGNTSGDIKISHDISTLTSISRVLTIGQALSSTDTTDCNGNFSVNAIGGVFSYGITSGVRGSIFNEFLVSSENAAGSFTLQWAQNASNATATVLDSTSHMIIKQLSGTISLLKWYSEDAVDWINIV